MKKTNIAFIIFIFVVIIDQISKYLVRQNGGFYVCNKEIAFSFHVYDFIFWPIWLAIFIFIVLYAIKNKSEVYFLSLILAGAASNMIDRLKFGCITDFIDFKIWPVFNLADAFISIGAILVIVSKIKNKK